MTEKEAETVQLLQAASDKINQFLPDKYATRVYKIHSEDGGSDQYDIGAYSFMTDSRYPTPLHLTDDVISGKIYQEPYNLGIRIAAAQVFSWDRYSSSFFISSRIPYLPKAEYKGEEAEDGSLCYTRCYAKDSSSSLILLPHDMQSLAECADSDALKYGLRKAELFIAFYTDCMPQIYTVFQDADEWTMKPYCVHTCMKNDVIYLLRRNRDIPSHHSKWWEYVKRRCDLIAAETEAKSYTVRLILDKAKT